LSYKKRNGLILVAFILIIASVGVYYSNFYFPPRIEAIEVEIADIEAKVEDIPRMQQELENYRNIKNMNTDKLKNLDKEVESYVPPAQTYAYFDRIQDRYGDMKMDVAFAKTVQMQGYGYNTFTINGEAYFDNLMRLIWALERGPKIYRITRLSMRGREEIDKDRGIMQVFVPYEMEIWTFFSESQDFPPIKRTLADLRMPNFYNAFWPMIYKDVPPNVNNLLEVDNARVQAILPGKAIVIAKDGRVMTLHEGDRVYLGYVSKIDNVRNRIEFTLNKGGIYERKFLTLNFE